MAVADKTITRLIFFAIILAKMSDYFLKNVPDLLQMTMRALHVSAVPSDLLWKMAMTVLNFAYGYLKTVFWNDDSAMWVGLD